MYPGNYRKDLKFCHPTKAYLYFFMRHAKKIILSNNINPLKGFSSYHE